LKSFQKQGDFAKGQKTGPIRISNLATKLDKLCELETWIGISGQGCHSFLVTAGITHIGPSNQTDSPGQGLDYNLRSQIFLKFYGFFRGKIPGMEHVSRRDGRDVRSSETS
jgi:hypothetical protein